MNLIFDILGQLGFDHPLHPVLVHLPIGLSAGAFFLLAGCLLGHRDRLRTSAWHVSILALIFTPLAIATGIMDWQRFYAGVWLREIQIKVVLAALLLVLLAAVVWRGRNETRPSPITALLLTLTLIDIGALGYFGGDLAWGSRTPEAPTALQSGQKIFAGNCSGCHPRGSNIIVPQLPLRTAPQLGDYEDFLAFLRDPKMPDGNPGRMPAFPPSVLSDQEVRALYDYLRFAFVESRRQETLPPSPGEMP